MPRAIDRRTERSILLQCALMGVRGAVASPDGSERVDEMLVDRDQLRLAMPFGASTTRTVAPCAFRGIDEDQVLARRRGRGGISGGSCSPWLSPSGRPPRRRTSSPRRRSRNRRSGGTSGPNGLKYISNPAPIRPATAPMAAPMKPLRGSHRASPDSCWSGCAPVRARLVLGDDVKEEILHPGRMEIVGDLMRARAWARDSREQFIVSSSLDAGSEASSCCRRSLTERRHTVGYPRYRARHTRSNT